MPRIDMISDKSQVDSDRHAEFDSIVETLHGVRGPFAVLMHSPGLAQKVMQAGAQVRLGSTLDMKERELAIIAVAREKDAGYEWAAHVTTGRNAGMREEAIEAVRHRQDVRGLEPDERDIITYVRQLLQANKVEQGLFEALTERHSVRWLVELTATIGQYQYISAINNAFDVQPAADADQLPA
jgi:4-carboxymuconolactone decarboxylase